MTFQPLYLLEALETHRKLILKPRYGHFGKNIYCIELVQENDFYFYRQTTRPQQVFNKEQEVISKLRSLFGDRKYIIQNKIEFSLINERLFDIRTLVQKSRHGYWQVTGAICRIAVTILPQSAIGEPFFDNFEDEPLGDVGPGANDGPWAGAADNFAFVVNIDAESIRPNTLIDRFGFQLLRFDNPYAAGSPPSMTIDQASREFNSTSVGLDFATPLILTFDIRTIQTVSLNPGIHAEVNIGRARAGRFVLATDAEGNLRAALLSGSPPDVVFFSDPLVFGQWYRIRYELDVANNRYNYIEIDGVRFDNDGEGWEANVGTFGSDIQHVLLIQGSNDADQEGIYLDNVSIWAPIPCEF